LGGKKMLTIPAPAKLNLTLEVLGKRSDGYHEIRSVIQTIGLCDSLHFLPGDKIEVKCDNTGWIPQQSLIPLAASLLQETSGCAKGVTISLSKKIPLLSGLAGDSSGAVAALLGLNRLWGLGYSLGDLAKLAEKLGSDIPFFFSGGTALIRGRGESVSPLPALPPMWVVLLMPEIKRTIGKTASLYALLKPKFYTRGEATEQLVTLLARGGEIDSSVLFNVFESVAYASFTGLEVYRDRFLMAGADSVHLAGSGPALFTLMKNKAEAGGIYRRLKEQDLEVYMVETIGGIDFMNSGMES
jgi:4-diphosphocytidyl-2-C-methyl-D-erythritol kinase